MLSQFKARGAKQGPLTRVPFIAPSACLAMKALPPAMPAYSIWLFRLDVLPALGEEPELFAKTGACHAPNSQSLVIQFTLVQLGVRAG